jgi:hypothetical protein
MLSLKKTMDLLILNGCPTEVKIVIPTPPCYLFTRCCADASHVSNLQNAAHCKTLLSSVMHLKNTLKKQLVTAGTLTAGFWTVVQWGEASTQKRLTNG